MKKLTKITAIMTLLFGVTVNAQNEMVKTTKEGPSFGIKGGLNMSNLYVEEVNDESIYYGFNAGVFAEIPLSSMISIQPEVAFTTKGAKVRYDNVFVEGATEFRLSYIEAPILLRVNIGKHFNIHAGPYAAYLVNAKITDEDSDGNIASENDLNEDDLERFDYGVAGGLAFEFDGGFGFGARYTYGLNTVGKERSILGQTYTSPDGKNNTLSFYATVKLY